MTPRIEEALASVEAACNCHLTELRAAIEEGMEQAAERAVTKILNEMAEIQRTR